ncbi:MAG: type IV pilus biogenesis/stability protein PilW [Betaproteobacteria bacterium]
MNLRVLMALLALALVLGSCSAAKQMLAPSAPPQPQLQAPETIPLARTAESTPSQRAQLRTDLAAGYYERGQMDVALEELAEAVRLDPANARAYNLYGLVYTFLGENPKAESNFQRALTLAPQDSEIRHNWGWYLCTHGQARDAMGEFEAALSNPLYRTPEIALVNAGRCAASFGDVKGAETYFRRALVSAPRNANASYGLALLAYKGARFEEARGWVKGALARNNAPPEALYLGMCIERSLGDRQSELSYISQLRNRYPDAAETRALGTGTCE